MFETNICLKPRQGWTRSDSTRLDCIQAQFETTEFIAIFKTKIQEIDGPYQLSGDNMSFMDFLNME